MTGGVRASSAASHQPQEPRARVALSDGPEVGAGRHWPAAIVQGSDAQAGQPHHHPRYLDPSAATSRQPPTNGPRARPPTGASPP